MQPRHSALDQVSRRTPRRMRDNPMKKRKIKPKARICGHNGCERITLRADACDRCRAERVAQQAIAQAAR